MMPVSFYLYMFRMIFSQMIRLKCLIRMVLVSLSKWEQKKDVQPVKILK